MKKLILYYRKDGKIDVTSVMLFNEKTSMVFGGRAFRSIKDQPSKKRGKEIATARLGAIVSEYFDSQNMDDPPDAVLETVGCTKQNYCNCHYAIIKGDVLLTTAFGIHVDRCDDLLSCREKEVLFSYIENKKFNEEYPLELPTQQKTLDRATKIVDDIKEISNGDPEFQKRIADEIIPLINLLERLLPNDCRNCRKS